MHGKADVVLHGDLLERSRMTVGVGSINGQGRGELIQYGWSRGIRLGE